MIGKARTSRSPIGVDIGSRYIKAAQLAGSPDQPKLVAAIAMERAGDALVDDPSWSDAEAQRLRDVLDRRGFDGRRIVTAVPSEQCLTGVFTLPPRHSGAPLGEIAAAEMGRMHHCDGASMQVAFWDLPRPARHSEGLPVMAAACREDQTDSHVHALEQAGLDVNALDIEGWALVRACRPQLRRAEGMSAIVNLGYSVVNLALVHGATLIYKRMLSGAALSGVFQPLQREHHFDPTVIDHVLSTVGLDDEAAGDDANPHLTAKVRGPLEMQVDQLVQELTLSLSYAAHQYPDAPVQQLILTGGGARTRGLDDVLAQRLDVDVMVAAPEMVCTGPESLATELGAPELTVAVGLAMHREEEEPA